MSLSQKNGQVGIKYKEITLDKIIDDAIKENPDPAKYLPIVQQKLYPFFKEQYPDEDRRFWFYSALNYFVGKHCPQDVMNELSGSNDADLIDVLQSANAIKCGQSTRDIILQLIKANHFATHNPGEWGSVVIGVPIGSPTTSFVNEQSNHVRLIEDHLFGEHYMIRNKLNDSIAHFVEATHAKIVFVGSQVGCKPYRTPSSEIDDNGNSNGEIYEAQRIADPAVRQKLEGYRSRHARGSAPNKWYTTELASKYGSSLLSSHKDIEAYLRSKNFWSSPYRQLVFTSHKSANARAEEAALHQYLLNSPSVTHVSGETFDVPVNVAQGKSMLQSFLNQRESESPVEELKPITIENTHRGSQYYRKLALQQYIQSGIITRDHILYLWQKGIIERC